MRRSARYITLLTATALLGLILSAPAAAKRFPADTSPHAIARINRLEREFNVDIYRGVIRQDISRQRTSRPDPSQPGSIHPESPERSGANNLFARLSPSFTSPHPLVRQRSLEILHMAVAQGLIPRLTLAEQVAPLARKHVSLLERSGLTATDEPPPDGMIWLLIDTEAAITLASGDAERISQLRQIGLLLGVDEKSGRSTLAYTYLPYSVTDRLLTIGGTEVHQVFKEIAGTDQPATPIGQRMQQMGRMGLEIMDATEKFAKRSPRKRQAAWRDFVEQTVTRIRQTPGSIAPNEISLLIRHLARQPRAAAEPVLRALRDDRKGDRQVRYEAQEYLIDTGLAKPEARTVPPPFMY